MNYIVANWKSNKGIGEAKKWLDQLLNGVKPRGGHATLRGYMAKWSGKVIIGAPFTVLAPLKEQLTIQPSNSSTLSSLPKGHPTIYLASQDLSPFPSGAYTGEVSGAMLKDLVDYVIVGHSERRRHFGETDAIVAQKTRQALDQKITPLVCLDEPYLESQISAIQPFSHSAIQRIIFAYEPLRAIGTGKPDTPENANQVAKRIKEAAKFNVPVIYGGSVTDKNVKAFVDQENINGVLVGGASLEVEKFRKIIKAINF